MPRFSRIKCISFFILGSLGMLVVFVGAVILWNSLDVVSCPVFDKNLASWFPYQKGDAFTFTAENGQTSNVVSFDSLHVQHRRAYNTSLKCGTCGDRVEAAFKIGANTLTVVTEGGDAMFDSNPVTALNDSLPTAVKRDASTLQLLWADSASASGITAACFKRHQGLVWYEQGKQRFYCTGKATHAINRMPPDGLVITNVNGCQ